MSRWSIILAGGEGTRLQSLTQRLYPDGRPKQFCALGGETRTMVEQTVDRAQRFSAPHRTVVSLVRDHGPWHGTLAGYPDLLLSIQPSHAGTGAAVLHGALQIGRAEERATVAVFPADHYVSDEQRFADHVHRAAAWVEERGEDVVLLGVEPEFAESEYGWLVPGREGIEDGKPFAARLVEKPEPAVAQQLAARGALWNTSVVVARVGTMLRLMEVLAPEWFLTLTCGLAGDRDGVEVAYRGLPPFDLSQDVLGHATKHVRALPVRGLAWSDWGNEARIEATLERLHGAGHP
jgi:mannose-1-phosphate guanylyltransferase